MDKRKHWTDEEDNVLVQAIIDSPHNKQEAFKQVAKSLNRSISACSSRWYTILSNPEHKKYRGCLFTMIGRYSRFDNRTINTNLVHTSPIKHKSSIWYKIKKLFGLQ